ncbi:MAG: glycosyltransferase family 39 protein [Thermoanaerobaculia bacterium]
MPARVAPWIVALLFACAAGLAFSAATTDSVTVDEPAHITSGYASLVTGDFRLSPDHPPLARWLLALPLLAQTVDWPAEQTEAWRTGDVFTLGREFFEQWNDGEHLIRASRVVAIAFLLGLLAAVAWVSRELHGTSGALLAATIVTFDPSWLAHGHLATIDVPFALAVVLVLAFAHRWLERPSPFRLTLLGTSFAALTLVKLSWPIVVPALLAMATVARWSQGPRSVMRTFAVASGVLAVSSILAIWAAYGFRFSASKPEAAPGVHMIVLRDFGRPAPADQEGAWNTLLHDPRTSSDRAGLAVPLLRGARALHLLPEAYLYGFAYVGKSSGYRAAYLRGEYSSSGFAAYFPWAFATKTPLPTLFLFLGSLILASAKLLRNPKSWTPLATGLGVFAATYFLTLARSGLNLGYRHLLPVTAMMAIAAGGLAPSSFPAPWRRRLSVAVTLALAWLIAGTLISAPNWIGYFNEAAGGWRNGHRFLADSNLDWGQDLLRLRSRLESESSATPVWLAQAGDPPLPAGMRVRWLWGDGSHAPDGAAIAGGLYVVSATDLLGVYRPLARAATWREARMLDRFEQLAAEATARRRVGPPPAPAPAGAPIDEYETLRRLRLVSRLAQREPNERIGTSLFVFRLSDAEVAEWTTP